MAVVLGVTLLAAGNGSSTSTVAGGSSGGRVERLLASLPAQPVDPTHVRLVSSVQTYPGCDSLLNDLRTVGAQHVGSRGFGYYSQTVGHGAALARGPYAQDKTVASPAPSTAAPSAAADTTTLGTNVQVAGVDEPDDVKAEGSLIYLDGKGDLRITDATTLRVRSTLAVAPKPTGTASHMGRHRLRDPHHAGIFGRDVEVIDVSNPAAPRRAGHVALPGPTGYFQPLPDQRALLVGSRTDTVPGKNGPITARGSMPSCST